MQSRLDVFNVYPKRFQDKVGSDVHILCMSDPHVRPTPLRIVLNVVVLYWFDAFGITYISKHVLLPYTFKIYVHISINNLKNNSNLCFSLFKPDLVCLNLIQSNPLVLIITFHLVHI